MREFLKSMLVTSAIIGILFGVASCGKSEKWIQPDVVKARELEKQTILLERIAVALEEIAANERT